MDEEDAVLQKSKKEAAVAKVNWQLREAADKILATQTSCNVDVDTSNFLGRLMAGLAPKAVSK